MAWELVVDRDDLGRVAVNELLDPSPQEGEVVLRVDRLGVSANNVTYAVTGDDLGYWDFFPTEDPAQGRVPHWGFAEVVASTVPEVAEGTRVYGYLPPGSHLVVEPDRIGPAGFRDGSAHRQHLPGAYNVLQATAGDPVHALASEDVQVLYRPLFMLSFMLSDHLVDAGCFGADAVVISSASSKTASGTAFLLDGVHRIGLTSAGNRDFVAGLGCYDEVWTYDQIEDLAPTTAVYVDVAGDPALRRRVHERLAPVHSAIVGATHHESGPDRAGGEELPGATPAFFFTPDHMRKRYADWGADGVEQRHADAWSRFAPIAEGWVEVVRGQGPAGLRDAWLATLAGRTPPQHGHVVDLGDATSHPSKTAARAASYRRGMAEIHHHISYVEIPAPDLDAATGFYASAFGWTFNAYGGQYAGIVSPDGAGEVGGLNPGSTPARGDLLVLLYSEDLAASQAAVEAAGGTITDGPYEYPGGHRFHFTDPAGNQLGVFSHG